MLQHTIIALPPGFFGELFLTEADKNGQGDSVCKETTYRVMCQQYISRTTKSQNERHNVYYPFFPLTAGSPIYHTVAYTR